MEVFVSCPKGMQYLLEAELKELGLTGLKPVAAGVEVSASLDQVYTVLLWSRIANRVFIELVRGKIDTADDLYRYASQVAWTEHFALESSFSVSFAGTNNVINNSTFGALKVKDAIVDHFREVCGERPSISKQTPDIRVSAKLTKGIVSISIDVSGESLHKRGYRLDRGAAPLKENIAAALLRQSGWVGGDLNSRNFVDPMCGSGTFCIEAALIATDTAPGLSRLSWGFDAWKQHDARKWGALVANAAERSEVGRGNFRGRIIGYDQDSKVISVAWQNVSRSGLSDFIHVEKKAICDFSLPEGVTSGVLLTNPPYGERLGEVEALMALYRDLGELFVAQLEGWRAGIFTGNEELENAVGWRYYKRYKFMNGAIESALLLFDLEISNRFKTPWMPAHEKLSNPAFWRVANPERAQMLSNRLGKNRKQFSKWAKRSDISCYRVYDADMPEYAFAIDLYADELGANYVYVQEYAPPKSIDESAALERLSEGLSVISQALDIDTDKIVVKQRSVQKGTAQYQKSEDTGVSLVCREYDARMHINLGQYLDTGVFLDHRAIRRWIHSKASDKRILNLFSYTCVVSLQAAIGGACSVTSVDMSQTYLKWGQRNFELNGLDGRADGREYVFERADCMKWLAEHSADNRAQKYDLIFIDPPSFSNSKRMEGVFDVQQDHVTLINQSMKLLNPGGVIVFSTNLRKFKLDAAIGDDYALTNFDRQSIDKDFERNSKIHKCWLIERR